MTTVKIRLRGHYEEIDLDALSPRARALAEAIAASPLSTATTVWLESEQPVSELYRDDWLAWHTPEQTNQPARREWGAWDKYRPGSPLPPTEYLERQAAKLPLRWHLVGHPPVPAQPVGQIISSSPDRQRLMTQNQALAALAEHGRYIQPATWRGYVMRKLAPQPLPDQADRLWDARDIEAYIGGKRDWAEKA